MSQLLRWPYQIKLKCSERCSEVTISIHFDPFAFKAKETDYIGGEAT